MIGKTRKEAREMLRTIGQVEVAREQLRRAEIIRQEAGTLRGKEKIDAEQYARRLKRQGGQTIRTAGKADREIERMLTGEEKTLIRMRYQRGAKWEDICRELHYSRDHLARMEREAVDKMRGAR